MNFQIINGAGLDGDTLFLSNNNYLTFNRQGKMIRIPTGSIAKIEKNEEFKKEVFFTITFTDNQTANAKSSKSDYEQVYKLQFTNPKVPFSISEISSKDFLMEHKKSLFIIGLVILFLLFKCSGSSDSSSSITSTSSFSPQECNYLTSFGLPTNAYHQQDNEDYICITDFLEVGQADSTGNESKLDFAVEGTASQITDVYLRAIYGNKSSSAAAREKFIDASKELITRTTNHPIPDKLLQAIKKGKEYKGTIDGKKITLEINDRNNYKQAKTQDYGYAHQLTIDY